MFYFIFEAKFFSGKYRGVCICNRCQCREQFDGYNCGENNCTYVEKNKCKKIG